MDFLKNKFLKLTENIKGNFNNSNYSSNNSNRSSSSKKSVGKEHNRNNSSDLVINFNSSDDFEVVKSNYTNNPYKREEKTKDVKDDVSKKVDFNQNENYEQTKEYVEKLYSHLYEIPIFKKILGKAKRITAFDSIMKIHQALDEISQGGFYSLDGSCLQTIMFSGIPDELPILRTLIWKLSLKYPDVKIIHTPKWQQEIDEKRNEYFKLVELHYKYINQNKGNKNNHKLIKTDHPLSSNDSSEWNHYFKDIELVEEIEKDVRRTRAQMSFFFMPADGTLNITNEEIAIKANYTIENTKSTKSKIENDFETHSDVLTRILYIYAKEFPNIRYVQGMNEVLATIYYQFCQDNDCDNDQFNEMQGLENGFKLKDYQKIEADSYFCFRNLMEEIKDLFIREKDKTRSGIETRIKGINILLREIDKEVYNCFVENGVEIQFFMFRWYTLLFTQEYELPDVMRLWDSLLSFVAMDCNKIADKFTFMNFLCIAAILMKKSEIINHDFAGIMLAYQNMDYLEVTNHVKSAYNILLFYKEKYTNN